MGMVYEVPPGSEPDQRNIFQKFWDSFSSRDRLTKLSLTTMLLILLITPIVITQQTNLSSHAGTSLFNNCTPIPVGFTDEQILQLSQSSQVNWCKTAGYNANTSSSTITIPNLTDIHFTGVFYEQHPSDVDNLYSAGIHPQYDLPSGGDSIILGNTPLADKLKQMGEGYIEPELAVLVRCVANYNTGTTYKGVACRDGNGHLTGKTQEDPTDALKAVHWFLNKLAEDPNRNLVKAFWAQDDEAAYINSSQSMGYGDDGHAREFIQQVHKAIGDTLGWKDPQHTIPAIPAICGFGVLIGGTNGVGNVARKTLFSDFSEQGCDMVGIYAYSYVSSGVDWWMNSIMNGNGSFDDYGVIPGLKAYGWNPRKEPLIGMPMAFSNGWSEAKPAADDLTNQIKSFCQNYGAVGIIPYHAEDIIGNHQFITGVKAGFQACNNHWYGTCAGGNTDFCTSDGYPPHNGSLVYQSNVPGSQCAINATRSGAKGGTTVYCCTQGPSHSGWATCGGNGQYFCTDTCPSNKVSYTDYVPGAICGRNATYAGDSRGSANYCMSPNPAPTSASTSPTATPTIKLTPTTTVTPTVTSTITPPTGCYYAMRCMGIANQPCQKELVCPTNTPPQATGQQVHLTPTPQISSGTIQLKSSTVSQ